MRERLHARVKLRMMRVKRVKSSDVLVNNAREETGFGNTEAYTRAHELRVAGGCD